ncbi:MAG: family 1 encapsulin nanocompartment shell protein [Bacteroidales bacterium]
MNILKKTLAPITEKAWEEIELQSERIIQEFLTGRKIADVNGPHGIGLGAISTGRLLIPSNQSKQGINFGIREVIPIVEVRKPFSLDLWEIDNASRNAEDLDLSALEKAARQIASFEDEALYYGFDNNIAKGLVHANDVKPVEVKVNTTDFLQALSEQVNSLQMSGVEGPYTLVLPDKVWAKLVADSTAYPLPLLLKGVTGGNLIVHHHNKDIFLVSERGGDFELHLGQDISLGYEGYDTKKVKLFFTESFAYQIHGPEAVRIMNPVHN